MDKYQVIDPKGFTLGGKKLEKGDKFNAERKNAHIQTALHFNQIREISARDKDADPQGK